MASNPEICATTHNIAIIFYTMVKKQVEYDEYDVTLWAQRDAAREEKFDQNRQPWSSSKGHYDFTMDLNVYEPGHIAPEDIPALLTRAMKQQLGLQLESKRQDSDADRRPHGQASQGELSLRVD